MEHLRWLLLTLKIKHGIKCNYSCYQMKQKIEKTLLRYLMTVFCNCSLDTAYEDVIRLRISILQYHSEKDDML